MEAGGERDVFVSHYAEDLGYLTDLWFATREAAVQDSEATFGEELGPWLPIPSGESHPRKLRLAATSLKMKPARLRLSISILLY